MNSSKLIIWTKIKASIVKRQDKQTQRGTISNTNKVNTQKILVLPKEGMTLKQYSHYWLRKPPYKVTNIWCPYLDNVSNIWFRSRDDLCIYIPWNRKFSTAEQMYH
jgi:hypothetical protein